MRFAEAEWKQKLKERATEMKERATEIQRKEFPGAKMVRYPYRISNAKSYWGQRKTYADGSQISFSYMAVSLPAWLRDYLIYHELTHTRENGRRYGVMHSPEFFRQLEEVYPNWRTARQALKEFGRAPSEEWLHKYDPNDEYIGLGRKQINPQLVVKQQPVTRRPPVRRNVIEPGFDPVAARKKFEADLNNTIAGWKRGTVSA